MDVKIQPQLLPPSVVQALRPDAAVQAAAKTGSQFANVLGDALKGVSELQTQSERLQTQFQMGVEGASLEETMVSMQKAQVAFQSAVTIRNRLVSAYSDIMNMNV